MCSKSIQMQWKNTLETLQCDAMTVNEFVFVLPWILTKWMPFRPTQHVWITDVLGDVITIVYEKQMSPAMLWCGRGAAFPKRVVFLLGLFAYSYWLCMTHSFQRSTLQSHCWNRGRKSGTFCSPLSERATPKVFLHACMLSILLCWLRIVSDPRFQRFAFPNLY